MTVDALATGGRKITVAEDSANHHAREVVGCSR